MRKLAFLLFFFGLTTCFAQIQPTKEALDKVMTFHTSATIGEESDFYIASAKTFWIDWGNGVWKAYPAAGAAFYAGGILKGSTVRVAGQKVWNVTVRMPITKMDLTKNDELVELVDNLSAAIQTSTIDFSGNPKLRYINLGRYYDIDGKGTLETLDLSHNPNLESVYLNNHQLKSLVFSPEAIELGRRGFIWLFGNKLDEEAMTKLVQSLPDMNNKDFVPEIKLLLAKGVGKEENVLSKKNYIALQQKGYQLTYTNNDLILPPTGIRSVGDEPKSETPIYDLSGRRITSVHHGLYIQNKKIKLEKKR